MVNKLFLAAAFVAGQLWAYGLGYALAPAATALPMASAPQCVTEVYEKPDIAAIIAALPANIKPMRQDEIAALIGGL